MAIDDDINLGDESLPIDSSDYQELLNQNIITDDKIVNIDDDTNLGDEVVLPTDDISGTQKILNPISASNNNIFDKYALLPEPMNGNLIPEDIGVISTLDELKKYLTELIICFDNNPKNYTVLDYRRLLRFLIKYTLSFFESDSGIIAEEENYINVYELIQITGNTPEKIVGKYYYDDENNLIKICNSLDLGWENLSNSKKYIYKFGIGRYFYSDTGLHPISIIDSELYNKIIELLNNGILDSIFKQSFNYVYAWTNYLLRKDGTVSQINPIDGVHFIVKKFYIHNKDSIIVNGFSSDLGVTDETYNREWCLLVLLDKNNNVLGSYGIRTGNIYTKHLITYIQRLHNWEVEYILIQGTSETPPSIEDRWIFYTTQEIDDMIDTSSSTTIIESEDDVIYGTWISSTEFNDTYGNAVVLVENKLYIDELTNERYTYLDNVLVPENTSNEVNYDGKITINYLQDSYPVGSAETNGKLAYNTSTNKLVKILYNENSGINITINISLNKHTLYIWENKVYVWNGISLMQIGVLSDYVDNYVSYSTQSKTEEEKLIARNNIDSAQSGGAKNTLKFTEDKLKGVYITNELLSPISVENNTLLTLDNDIFVPLSDGYSIYTYDITGIEKIAVSGISDGAEVDNEGETQIITGYLAVILDENYNLLQSFNPTEGYNLQEFTDLIIDNVINGVYLKLMAFTEGNKVKIVNTDRLVNIEEDITALSENKRDNLSNSLTIYRLDSIWENDLLLLLTEMASNFILSDIEFKVRNSYGDATPDFKIVYNDNKAYLSCKEVTKNSNWEFLTIKYNLIYNNKTYLPDLRGKIGKNYLQDEDTVNIQHSNFNAELFRSFYEVIGENKRQTLKSLDIKGNTISQTETDEYAVKYKFNLVARPYVGGATQEEYSSCPDILTVASHYDNTNAQHNITADANTFLKNTIAVSAGTNLDGTGIWTSYGFGVEFFEASGEFLTKYPDEIYKNFYGRVFKAKIDSDKRTIHLTDSNLSLPGRSANQLSVGSTVFLHYPDITINSNSKIEFKIASIIDNTTIIADRDLVEITDATTTDFYSYINVFRKLSYAPEQSATCSIIATKFAAIQDRTDANWQLVREAARMTASNSTYTTNSDGLKVWTTNWDMKRGFGVIDVDLAVEYIEQWYSNNQAYKDCSQPHLEKGNLLLGYDDINDDNYLTKKLFENKLIDYNETVNNSHIQNTDSQLLSPDGNHSITLDNAGNLNVENIVQNGSSYETHAEQIYTKTDEIILREGAVSGLGTSEYAGFRAKLYDGVNDGLFVFDKDGFARVGDVGNLVKLAAIEENPTGALVYYDTTTYQLKSANSAKVIETLGYTPYNATNPNGYITSSASITGNAATATVLQTARTIGLSGVTATAQSFNGSANITIPISAIPTSLLSGTVSNSQLANSSMTIADNTISLGGSLSTSILKSSLGLGSNAYTSYQNILERSYSGAIGISSSGWYRIGEFLQTNTYGNNIILEIHRNFANSNNEAYIFSISMKYGGGINISQLSGNYVTHSIEKIRVDYITGGMSYIDMYINTSVSNSYYWSTSFGAKSYTTATLISTPTGSTYEFSTVNGFKNDYITGSLTGNSSTATTLQTARTIWGQSFNGSADITGALSGATTGSFSSTVTVGNLINLGLTSGCILYANSSKQLTNSPIYTDGTNVGINMTTPIYKLDVNGQIRQTAVTSSLLKADASGALVAAVAGTDYLIPSYVSGNSYTPIFTNLVNTSSVNINYSVYSVINEIVFLKISGYYTPTTTATATSFNFSLPYNLYSQVNMIGGHIIQHTGNGSTAIDLDILYVSGDNSVLKYSINSSLVGSQTVQFTIDCFYKK